MFWKFLTAATLCCCIIFALLHSNRSSVDATNECPPRADAPEEIQLQSSEERPLKEQDEEKMSMDIQNYMYWSRDDVESWILSLQREHKFEIDMDVVTESLKRLNVRGKDMEYWDYATLESIGISQSDVQNYILNQSAEQRITLQ